jgi:hypothetical protein
MSDCYYELIGADEFGDKFTATDMVRSTWTDKIQHAAPVSALLVRALERCVYRDDTRLSRVVVDLLGPVPAEGEFWVNATLDRKGKQTELVSAQMLGPGPDGRPRPVARASGWRFQHQDTHETVRTGAPGLRPVSEGKNRNLAEKWDPNYLHSLEWVWLTKPLNEGPGESWIRPTVDLVKGEVMTPLERLFAVADCANGIGSKLDITKWTFLNTDLAVHVFRIPDGDWIGIRAETSYGPDGVATTIGMLLDPHGAIGSIAQSVLVRRRP